jgi:hypothetical protein
MLIFPQEVILASNFVENYRNEYGTGKCLFGAYSGANGLRQHGPGLSYLGSFGLDDRR